MPEIPDENLPPEILRRIHFTQLGAAALTQQTIVPPAERLNRVRRPRVHIFAEAPDRSTGNETESVEPDDVEDMTLAPGSDMGSGISPSGVDSGINLPSPSDSELSLEDDEPLDLGGSSISSLELPDDDDDDIIALDSEADDSDETTQLTQDEDFLLSPSGEFAGEESNSGSQVIALEDSEAFDEDAATMIGGGGGAALAGANMFQPVDAAAPGYAPQAGSQAEPRLDVSPAAHGPSMPRARPAPRWSMPRARPAPRWPLMLAVSLVAVLVGGVAYWLLHNRGDRQTVGDAAHGKQLVDEGNLSETEVRSELPQYVRAAVGDLPSYRDQLITYAARHPESPHTADFRRVVEEQLPLVERLLQWNQTLDEWSAADMRDLSPQQAGAMVAAAQALLKDFGQLPQASAIRERLPALAAVANRENSKGQPIQAGLTTHLANPAVSTPWMLQTKTGQRYYLPAAPDRDGDTMVFEYVADLRLARRRMTISRDEMDSAASGKNPQAALASSTSDALAKLTNRNWESMFFRILRDIHAEPRLDPLVKVQWMKHVLSVGCQGSQPLRTAFEEHLALLESIDISDDVNWLDPQDAVAEQLRAACASVLSQLPDLTAAAAEAAQQFKSLETISLPGRYQWVGVLFREGTGTWQIASRAAPGPAAGRLLILYRPIAEAAWLLKVGELAGERMVLSTTDDTWLLEGCPVYAEIFSTDFGRAARSVPETPRDPA